MQPSLVFALVIHSNILSGGFLFFQLQRYCWLWVLINSTEATNYSFCDLSNDLLDSTQSIQLVTILLPVHHKVPTSLVIYHSIKDSIEIVWKIQPPPSKPLSSIWKYIFSWHEKWPILGYLQNGPNKSREPGNPWSWLPIFFLFYADY